MKKILACLFLFAALPTLGAWATTNDILVGINYFSGWWEELPNRWHGHGWTTNEPDWRAQFSDRIPLLGCYNDQATMDREIVAAATHGVDFFAFLWYFAPAGSTEAATTPLLNRGQLNFRNSTNAPMMQFMLEYCNHANLNAITDAEWNACVVEWVAAMRHPSYLRVGGKLVFKLHDAYQFWMKNGQDLTRCRARLESLRQQVRETGLGEMLIGGGIMSGSQVHSNQFVAQLFDFTGTYLTVPAVQPREAKYPYATLAAEFRAARARHANDPIPYVPYLGAGWNPRPWTHQGAAAHHRTFFTFPTRAEWYDELRAVRDDFARYPGLGLPLPDGKRQKIFTIYAWNEFGEGGIMAPTQGEGMMKLEEIKEVFRTSETGWERNPQPLLWNFVNMYNPCVVETGGEYRFKMWFFGWSATHANQGASWPGCDAIFHARSKDLKHWEVYSKGDTWDSTMNPTNWVAVLHATDRWYEAWHVGDPSVVLHDGKFYIAYSATSKPFQQNIAGYPSRMVQCVMGATSDDGIHWQRTAAPLLIYADDAAVPRPSPNRIGDFHRPCLRWENERWRLWFDYWLPGKGVCMGNAENTGDFAAANGFKFTHDLKQPLIESWPNPEVIKIGNRYHSFSDALGYPTPPNASPWMRRQLREAISDDGVHWEKLAFIPPDPDTDACHVPQTLVTTLDGQRWLYLFYSTQIGYKKHDGQYHYEYDRIRAMRRKL